MERREAKSFPEVCTYLLTLLALCGTLARGTGFNYNSG